MMKNMMTNWAFAVSFLALCVTTTEAHPELKFGDSNTETKLPKPMSDVSASVGPDGMIYIAGGCDSPFGSQYDDDAETFRCESVSDSFYSFDPVTEEFIILPTMPFPRYRHSAVAINNQIWIVGGRDAEDEVVGTVVVFDLEDMRWRVFGDLHYTYWVSDLGGFVANDRAYFAGGFSSDYRAVARVFSIDPVGSWATGRLQIVRHANMVNRRGDFGITFNEEEQYAYVSGGSTHTNQFCSPLDTVERYDLESNAWVELPPLQQGRTGKSAMQIGGQLVALGGAQQISKLCDKTNPNPTQFQTPVHSIEVLANGTWDVVDELKEYRFRSTSVVFNDTVYSFGGQSVYFTVCQCHPTVDDVVIYQVVSEEEQPPESEYVVNTATGEYGLPSIDLFNEILAAGGGTDAPTGEGMVVVRDGPNDAEPKDGTTQGGFGGGAYNRDSNGLNGATSGTLMASASGTLSLVIGIMAVLVM